MPTPENWNLTPTRPIRVEADLWEAFGEAVAQLGTNRSEYLREVMRWVIHDTDGSRPATPVRPTRRTPRPSAEDTGASTTHAARTIRLTEPQAEAIEYAVANGGRYVASTSTSSGRRQGIVKAKALVDKGILRLVKHGSGEDEFELTDFGREVYDIHPKVIRR